MFNQLNMNILLKFSGFILSFIVVLFYERKIRNLSTKSKNNVHFDVARDEDGFLFLYIGKPFRCANCFNENVKMFCPLDSYGCKSLGLNKKDFQNLKWEDEPIEVFLNLED